jgi:hypothetical protein
MAVKLEGVTLSTDRRSVVLWGATPTRKVLAKCATADLRSAMRRPNISSEACRMLVAQYQAVFARMLEKLLEEERERAERTPDTLVLELDSRHLATLRGAGRLR